MPLISSQPLSWSVLTKWEYRIPLFISMMKESGHPFTLMSGASVSIPYQENALLAVVLQTKVRAGLKEAFDQGVVAYDRDGNRVPVLSLGQIHKCSRFGGKPSGLSLRRESAQIDEMNRGIVQGSTLILRSTISGKEIVIQDVSRVEKIPGSGKGDAKIFGSPNVRVSLKWADAPEQMNQWGGSKFMASTHVWDQFSAEASKWDGSETLVLPIPSDQPELHPTLWGEGNDSVDAILVSKSPIVQGQDGVLICDHVYFRGEIPEGGWAPALVLRRFRGRKARTGSIVLKDARIGVYPLHYRAGRVLSVNRLERGCIYTLPNAMEV